MKKPLHINCETARLWMMDRLYGSLKPQSERKLDDHIGQCPHCAQEWDDVQAAHQIYGQYRDMSLPASTDTLVLNLSIDEKQQEPNRRQTSRIRFYAAAASITLLFFVSYFSIDLFHNQNPGSENFSIVSDSPKPTLDFEKSPAQEMEEVALSMQDTERFGGRGLSAIQAKDAAPADEKKSARRKASLADTFQRIDKPEDAESIFRAGMLIYNRAFSKTGETRNVLLNEAIDLLNELKSTHEDQQPWTAMAKIIIADSFQQIGKADRAIATYQSMIDQFPGLEPYNQEARLSMIDLQLKNGGEVQKAIEWLNDYFMHYPANTNSAEAAFAVAGIVEAKHPEDALQWYRKVLAGLPESSPIARKADEKAYAIEAKMLDKEMVQDWWILGPLAPETVTYDVPGFEKGNFGELNPNFVKNKTNCPNSWKRPFRNGNGVVKLDKFKPRKMFEWSAYTATNVYSPTDRAITLQFKAHNGIRIWINEEQVWGRANGLRYGNHWYTAAWHLKEGWNSIWIKTYHKADDSFWEFAFRILDPKLHILPDLQFDPSHPIKK